MWPEYNLHSDVVNPHWARRFDEFPAYQFVLHEDEVLGEGHTAPCHWDGTPDGLGEGIDAMIVAALDTHGARRPPNALCALAAEIRPRFQGSVIRVHRLVPRIKQARLPRPRPHGQRRATSEAAPPGRRHSRSVPVATR